MPSPVKPLYAQNQQVKQKTVINNNSRIFIIHVDQSPFYSIGLKAVFIPIIDA